MGEQRARRWVCNFCGETTEWEYMKKEKGQTWKFAAHLSMPTGWKFKGDWCGQCDPRESRHG